MSNRKWGIALLVLLIGFVYTLAQFILSTARLQEQVNTLRPQEAEAGSVRRIVLISQELDNPFWRAIEQGARDTSQLYEMDLEYAGPFRINPEEQLQLLEQAIASRADAILVQGTGEARSRSLIDKAADLGIPVITVDADEPDSRRLSYVGTDNLEAGKEMGRLLARATGGSGKIGVILGTSRADSQRLRLEGFRSIMGNYPEMTIADVQFSNISRLQASEQTRSFLTANPDLKAVVGFSSLDGLGAMDAAQRLGRPDLHLFAFDDLEETQEAVQEGRIDLTLVQQPLEMGAVAVKILNDYFQGKEIPSSHFTSITLLDGSGAAKEWNGERSP